MSSLDELNRPQRDAVTTIEGPLLVLAGAGSGKTRVITYRINHLLERGVAPEQILAVSFTNKAAEEMRERVEKMVGPRTARRLTLSTFHALGLRLLKQEKAALGFQTGFTVYDTADQLGVVREVLRDVRMDERRFDVKAILHRISRWKNAFVMPDELPFSDDDYDIIAGQVYPRYEKMMNGFHAVDFDDLIVATVRLLDEDAAVRARWAARFRFVMVDEYQDTNRAQLLLVRHLAAVHKNLCVVGDDDQSIYAWRGAESSNILEFDRHFPGAKVVTLDENYRSQPLVLEAANAVIANNKKRHPKTLYTLKAPGEKLHLVVAPDAASEARFVAEEIEMLRQRRGHKLADCAVMYRSNIQARAFEEALRTQRIPYRMIGGQAFYERKEVKDAIAYLKVALQPRDEIALRRIINYPSRGIGDVTIERCAAYAAAHHTTLWNALVRAEKVEGLTPQAKTAIAVFVRMLEDARPSLEAGRDLSRAARALVEQAGIHEDLRTGSGTPSQAQRRVDNLEDFLAAIAAWEERTRAEAVAELIAAGQQEAPGPDGAVQHEADSVAAMQRAGAAAIAAEQQAEGVVATAGEAAGELAALGDAAEGEPLTPLVDDAPATPEESASETRRRRRHQPAPVAPDAAPVSLAEYLHRMSLSSSDDEGEAGAEQDQVTLVTLHGAKGLEYPVVFLVGLEEELLPHRRTLYPTATDVNDLEAVDAIDLSEERRLLYVGITRAREILYISRARTRSGRGGPKSVTPSRFLQEIPAHLCDERDLELPGITADPADEEAFARECLARLKGMLGA